MKILMVTERYIPIWGGAENQLRQLIPHLVSKGCEIQIVTRRWHEQMPKNEKVDNVWVRRIGKPGTGLLNTVSFIFALVHHLLFKSKDIQIFHSHGALKLGALCALSAKLAGNRNIAKIASAGRIPKLVQTSVGRGIAAIFKISDAIICMTTEIEQELCDISCRKEKIVCIRNAVDCDRFRIADEFSRKEFFNNHHLVQDGLLIVFSSRLVFGKGLDVILAAWPEINKKNPHAYLLIVGSGKDQRDSIESAMREKVIREGLENIIFYGETTNPEKLLGISDIFVFPSRKEGFPNALMEGLAVGLPAVCSRIGGVLPLVEDGKTGILFESENSEQLAEKLDILLKNRELRLKLGMNARSSMKEKYSFERTSDEYYQLYERLCNN